MSNSTNKKINIKQILGLIFIVLIIILGIFGDSKYNENNIDTNINEKIEISYRVIPFYEGENKVASGVTIEIASVEDKGEKLHYYVYVYNVQPGIIIDYSNGESKLAE